MSDGSKNRALKALPFVRRQLVRGSRDDNKAFKMVERAFAVSPVKQSGNKRTFDSLVQELECKLLDRLRVMEKAGLNNDVVFTFAKKRNRVRQLVRDLKEEMYDTKYPLPSSFQEFVNRSLKQLSLVHGSSDDRAMLRISLSIIASNRTRLPMPKRATSKIRDLVREQVEWLGERSRYEDMAKSLRTPESAAGSVVKMAQNLWGRLDVGGRKPTGNSNVRSHYDLVTEFSMRMRSEAGVVVGARKAGGILTRAMQSIKRLPKRTTAPRRRVIKKSFQVERAGVRRGGSISKPTPLKRRESGQRAFKLSSLRAASLGQDVNTSLEFKLPSHNRVIFGAQQMSAANLRLQAQGALSISAHKAFIAETVMRQAVLRAAKSKSSMRGSMMQAQSRMAVMNSSALKAGVRGKSVTALKTLHASKRSRSVIRNAGVFQHIFAMPQYAQLLNMFRAASARSRGEISAEGDAAAQRIAGQTKQTASIAFAVSAQQARSATQTKAAAPFASARMQLMAGQRSPGQINSTLAMPAPVMQEQDGRILSPDAWIDGSLYELVDHVEPELAQEFFTLIAKQLQKGPSLIADDELRIKANACLHNSFALIDRRTWDALLRVTLIRAVHHVLLFTKTGMRGAPEIVGDASMLLDVDGDMFTSWEEYFGVSCIAENLKEKQESLDEQFPSHQDLVNSLDQEILRNAVSAFSTEGCHSAFLHSFEVEVQWKAAGCCALQDSEEKVEKTTALIVHLSRKDREAASRLLTMIVRHSILNKLKMSSDVFLKRWVGKELRKLIINLSNINAAIVTDTYFRSQLTSWENSGLNKLIIDANQARAMERMKKLDSSQPFEDFFEVLEESGRNDEVMEEIFQTMARNFNKLN